MVLEHGGDPDLIDTKGSTESRKNITPLFTAIRSRNLKNVKLLIDAGSKIDHQNGEHDDFSNCVAGLVSVVMTPQSRPRVRSLYDGPARPPRGLSLSTTDWIRGGI